VLVALSAILVSCLPATRPSPSIVGREEETARQLVHADLAARNFPSALARIGREQRPEKSFAVEYAQALNGLLAAADLHRQADRFEDAGPLLRQALNAYPRDPELLGRVDRPAAAVRADLQQCADRLMEKGLAAYRAGRLEEAIATWKRLLAFHPDHQAARQAVETASLQLRNLRSLQ
jgi:tetratricopeptide (TPR) repeat protein